MFALERTLSDSFLKTPKEFRLISVFKGTTNVPAHTSCQQTLICFNILSCDLCLLIVDLLLNFEKIFCYLSTSPNFRMVCLCRGHDSFYCAFVVVE